MNPRVRLLVIPGLHGSGPDHWQSRLERAQPGSVRIAIDDWGHADLDRWAAAIDAVLHSRRAEAWVAVAHSFGCLALAHHAARSAGGRGRGIGGALLVAPANPDRFGLDERPLAQALPFASTLVVSANDPWMSHADALYFGRRWGSQIVEAGEAGHINPATGYGAWPEAHGWIDQHAERLAATLRPRARPATPALGFAI